MKTLITFLFLICLLQGNAESVSIPRHGAYDTIPGEKWEDAYVSGNGRMGAMLFGKPGKETFIANHCRLFLPLGNREIVPQLAEHLPKIRKIYREKSPEKAQEFILNKAKEQGYPDIVPTDPFHPGLFIHINQDLGGPIEAFHRTENFQTGEVITTFQTATGRFTRKMFVSRAANMILLSIKGPGTFELEFPEFKQELITEQISVSSSWVGYHNVYTKGKGGYDTGIRISKKGGKSTVKGNKIQFTDADEVTLQIRIVPWKTPLSKEISEAWAYNIENPDFQKTGIYIPNPPLAESSQVAYLSEKDSRKLLPAIKKSLMKEKQDYTKLLKEHVKIHQALFDRVSFDLHSGDQYKIPVSQLIKDAETHKKLSTALMEKMYDAGRYMLICSAGELLPNLQGIWSGTWTPAWSADFTLDTNVQAALAAACSANLTELQEGFFRTIESYYPEWKINALRMYGCRGVLTNARASNTALLIHWGDWPGNFWTAGCGWLASFFIRYVDYTQDLDFLKERCLPLLKEVALFYEDFLSEQTEDGHVEFIPSYNPETKAGINATMDIAVAKEVLTNLIRFSRQLGIEKENINKWESLLSKLPNYPINNGTLTEWQDHGTTSNHRHHSQLYPCFQSFDPLFESNKALRAAAQSAIHLKIDGLDGETEAKGQLSSFSRIQCGISAAYLGMAEEAYGRLEIMATKRNMNYSLITSHDPQAYIYNTDGNGGIPQIVATMLAFSRVNSVDLLRALPEAWPSGSIKGLNLACGCTIDIDWEKGKLISAIFHATRDTKFTVTYKQKQQQISMKKGDIFYWK